MNGPESPQVGHAISERSKVLMTAIALSPWGLQVDGQFPYEAVVMPATATGGGLVCTLPLRPQESDTEIPPITDTYIDGKVLQRISVRKDRHHQKGGERTK